MGYNEPKIHLAILQPANARSVDIRLKGTQAILGYVSGEIAIIDLKARKT